MLHFTDLKMNGSAAGMTDMPFIHLPTPILALLPGSPDATCEILLSNTRLTPGQNGALRYRYNDDLLFGVIELPETKSAPDASGTPLQQTARAAYTQILSLLETLNYTYMYRFWNYMSDINGMSDGLERYRQFNLGRHEAFLASGHDVTRELPAACALGLVDGPLRIAFLAGRTRALSIENPRQVNAYQYPQEYGPRSPTFSRANLLRLPQEELLFISGTASIVGHKSLHVGDVVAQTRETMANLEAVIAEANRQSAGREFNLQDILYRVYVRNAADVTAVRNEMKRIMGTEPRAIFLQADICREDLLLEIEATASHTYE